VGFFSDLGKSIKGTIKNPFGDPFGKGPNASISHHFRIDREKRRKESRIEKNAAEIAQAEADMANAANSQLIEMRRRRRLSSLFAGGRSVLGAPAGRGTPAGSGSPVTSSAVAGGSAMGGGSRSYGGASLGSTRGGRMYAGERGDY
jgi:hypothetical protein